jgi:predicted nucleic acid-binding protein
MTPVPTLFVDSNVLIEAVFLPDSAAAIVAEMVATGVFDMVTCEQVVHDVERAILRKCASMPDELDTSIDRWSKLLEASRLKVLPDPAFTVVKEVYNKYIGVMRHKADIPILPAALECRPPIHVILSGNTEHFNESVATRSGVRICSCVEFIELLGKPK